MISISNYVTYKTSFSFKYLSQIPDTLFWAKNMDILDKIADLNTWTHTFV